MPRFITLPAKLAAAALAALLATAGLAVAGVDLPDPADQAFQKAGLSLPNQSGGPESAGNPSSQAQDSPAHKVRSEGSSLEGCEFGQEVAKTASGDDPTAGDPCDGGSEATGQTGKSHSQRGRSTAEAAPQGSRETGENASQDGRANAPTTAPLGSRETGETQSDAGQQTGQEHSQQGQETGDNASGGRKP